VDECKPLGRGNSYELYGPVNILSSHKYDRAMAGFLACLQVGTRGFHL
jgi:hypothetical protein